ncbi:hypothetical protein [Enterococcus sp. BWR-S5]|uniref:hypothetical protein n=1 Tax=Enterococcus sp. BWR-S5 TaxID=2787714 RepID=UPI0019245D09|nr:hypothetical protein [Enterococcus sp. BWR-S5]MBL1224159.1 hypothetical protein [Enterococcus sp. BWR-S5]
MRQKAARESSSESSKQETSYTTYGDGQIIPKRIDREENGLSVSQYGDLPKSEEKQKLENIQLLVVVIEQGFKSPTYNEDFVADFETEKMYLYPSISSVENTFPEWKLAKQDTERLSKLIETYSIQDWENSYGERKETRQEGPDEADLPVQKHWEVLLVYKDNTISKHEGYGESKPKQFDNFHQELMDFREEQREKWRATIEE